MIKNCNPRLLKRGLVAAAVIHFVLMPGISGAQDRLKTMPGYEQYQKMSKEIPTAVKLGALIVTWKDDGRSFEYRKEGKLYRYEVTTRKMTEIGPAPAEAPRAGRQSAGPARGRQFDSAVSPDKKLKAF